MPCGVRFSLTANDSGGWAALEPALQKFLLRMIRGRSLQRGNPYTSYIPDDANKKLAVHPGLVKEQRYLPAQ